MVRVVGHEGTRKLGNGSDGELGPPAMADACPAAERSEESAVAEPPKESGPHAPIIVLTDLG